jgi:glycine cleavage system aminomethyltransferase T
MNESIHADIDQTVLISERRFEQSPYFDCYAKSGMVLGVYAGRFYPKFIGDDPAQKYWALRCKAALYDVPERPVQIAGPDVVPFLERVFARTISNLKEGRGRYAIACTPQGGVFMDGILFKLSEGTFWYVQPDGALEPWFIAHSEGFDISVSDPKSRVLQIQGPNSLEVMRAASDGGIDESLGYFHAGFFDLGGQELYVSRTGWTGELGYEIYSQGAKTDCRRLWNHIIDSGTAHGLEFSSAASMEIRRIEAGILDNITDMDMTMTPFQAGLGAFINLEKRDFVGRAALLEADRKRLLYGVKCETAKPTMTCEVLDGAQVAGRVTAGAWSPYLESGIGYVRFNEPGAWLGQTLSLKVHKGEVHTCEIVELPFYDPQKRIARGLETSIPEPP